MSVTFHVFTLNVGSQFASFETVQFCTNQGDTNEIKNKEKHNKTLI
ncbi:hypothetical protein N482_09015 [Pseudoalteromonas luteoviolacea NCIMB 1942]|uniref:Uncharacterized protein n=1 Tax=Pseudoalteromonas luteoviolacea NCIMB 1942 TaxID=1365253 RepID=A0A167CK12_9GAMM|nr:hypothetical protein N482_09015 [Pseudoalteromonas luteoviolacea NCIMB 1942]